MSNNIVRDVVSEFSTLPWHDSQLTDIHIWSSSKQGSLQIDINLGSDASTRRSVQLQLIGCRGALIDLDLLGKALCSHQISTAFCEPASESNEPFVKRLNEEFDLNPGESTNGLFVFSIDLISPGGKLIVVAKDFAVS